MFARRTPPPGSGLHQCRLCHDDYVVPVWWEAAGDEQWHLLLRCGQCETYREVTVGNDVAERYEQDLARGRAEIAALRHDLIDAGDFGS